MNFLDPNQKLTGFCGNLIGSFFLWDFAYKPTNKQMDTGENMTSFAEVTIS